MPELSKQKELADILWAMDETKKSYQKLIFATDELVKSQFIGQKMTDKTSTIKEAQEQNGNDNQ